MLKNICKINVQSHTKNTTAMPADKKAGRKNTGYFTLLILFIIQFTAVAAIFHHYPSKNFKTSTSLLPKPAGAFFTKVENPGIRYLLLDQPPVQVVPAAADRKSVV